MTMPGRSIAAEQLAIMLGVISHPIRLRIIEELRKGELDVHTLQEKLELKQAAVSHHLGLLRSHKMVVERREGRHVYYRLRSPAIARWLVQGLKFLDEDRSEAARVRTAIRSARRSWSG